MSFNITKFDVVVIIYWGDAFLGGNFLSQVDEPWKYKIQHRKHAKEKIFYIFSWTIFMQSLSNFLS